MAMEIVPILGFSEPVSSWLHLLAAGLSAFGAIILYRRGRGNFGRLLSLMVFSFSLVFLFSMSGVYHLLEPQGLAREVFKHLDHSAIWILIAGTFTPIHAILFRGPWRWGILLLVWAVAITGLVLKIVFFAEIPEWLGLIFYLSLGWLGIVSAVKLKSQFETDGFKWLFLGGVAYSIGAIFEFLRWPVIISGFIGPHEIFHVFVILGGLCHWIFVFIWSSHPVKDTMRFEVRVYSGPRYLANAIGESLSIEATSKDSLHLKIRSLVREKYHKSIRPQIHLRYFQEEILDE